MYQTAIVPFSGTSGFISIRNEQTGKIYVSPKSVCEMFRVDWRGQRTKLASNSKRWQYETISITLPGDVQQREVAILPMHKVQAWILRD